MFFVVYLRQELRRRMRQTLFVALGLALGVGLVITVTAVSSGVNKADGEVVHALYGIGTDLTVTENNPPFSASNPLPGQCAPGLNLPAGQSCSAKRASATRRWG